LRFFPFLLALFLVWNLALEGAYAEMVCSDCRQPISGTFVRMGREAFHPQHFACAACDRAISGNYVPHQGKPYHAACYAERFGERCGTCSRPISGKFIKHEGQSYHTACFQTNVAPKCDVCGAGMVGRYLIDPLGNRYHSEHRIPLCAYCRRVVSPNTSKGGYTYADGRSVCGLCYPQVIRSDRDAVAAVEEVRAKLADWGLEVPQSAAPLKLVDLTTLKQLMRRGGLHGQNVQGFTSVLSETRGGQLTRREIAVYVLNGMPREDFMGTVAHELTHVWINLNASKKLHPALEEGACNYVRSLVHSESGSADAERNLKAMQDDPDEHYGRGYRRAKAYADRNGLPALLTLMRRGSAFPLGY